MSEKNYRVAIVPGSFDPITNGHINILCRAAKDYDKVYLAVMINAAKEYTFTMDERVDIARAAVADVRGVEVISSEGYLWQLAENLGAEAIVKGVRNDADREYELKMAEYNLAHNPRAKTVLLDADPELECISSTLVRDRLRRGEDISDLLPKAAAELVVGYYSKK